MTDPTRPRCRTALAGLVLAVAPGANGCSGGDEGSDETVRLPALTLPLLDGGSGTEVDLGAASSAPRVINLWATWCAPCRAELPAFDAVAAAAGSSLDVLGVNVAEDPEKAALLVDELGLTFAQAVDEAGDLSAELEVVGLPATIFANESGEVVAIHTGALTEERLSGQVETHFDVVVDSP